jgi:hypothetical protein
MSPAANIFDGIHWQQRTAIHQPLKQNHQPIQITPGHRARPRPFAVSACRCPACSARSSLFPRHRSSSSNQQHKPQARTRRTRPSSPLLPTQIQNLPRHGLPALFRCSRVAGCSSARGRGCCCMRSKRVRVRGVPAACAGSGYRNCQCEHEVRKPITTTATSVTSCSRYRWDSCVAVPQTLDIR